MRTGFCPLSLLGAKKLWCHTVDDDVRGEIFAVVHLRVTPVGEKNALKHLGTIGGGCSVHMWCSRWIVGKFHSLLISAALTVYIPHTFSALWLLPLFQSFFLRHLSDAYVAHSNEDKLRVRWKSGRREKEQKQRPNNSAHIPSPSCLFSVCQTRFFAHSNTHYSAGISN